VRIWLDMSAPAHPLIFGPIADRMRQRGHTVEVTARDHAETLELLALRDIEHLRIGKHGGARRSGKLAALLARTRAMVAFGRGRRFDLALAHGSNELALAAAALAIPAVTMTDYEFAVQQHHIGVRLARRTIVPETIPPERLLRFGADRRRIARYPGLKEDYYLAELEPDPSVLETLGLDASRVIATLRPPADLSLYHRKSNPLFHQVLLHLGRRDDVHAVVLPRNEAQRRLVESQGLSAVVLPRRAVDARSLIGRSDLVVSAVGTMNREAAALGTPAYTIFGGRLGAVDETLIREGRLRPLTDPRGLDLAKRPSGAPRTRRDPDRLVDLILDVVEPRKRPQRS
jgi:predicted glycosyltransferase